MANQGKSGSYFVVDLGEVKLPPLTEKQVEAEIQSSRSARAGERLRRSTASAHLDPSPTDPRPRSVTGRAVGPVPFGPASYHFGFG